MRFILMCFFVATMIVTDSAFSADYEVENNGKMYLALSINSGIAVAKGSYSESWSGMPPSYYILNTPYVSGISGSIVTQYTVRIHVKTDFGGNCLYGFQNYNVITPENPEFITLPIVVDSDGDGLNDEKDPCPDIADTDLDIGRSENKCTGEWYAFVVSSQNCDGQKAYVNPLYTEEERAAAIAAAKTSGCYALTGMSKSPEQVQAFWDNAKANNNENATQAADINDTDLGLAQDIVDLSNGQSSNSTEKTPLPEAAKSDDPHTQEILDELERLRVSISNDTKDQTSEIKGALAGVEVEINGGASRVVNETRDVKNAVQGMSNSMYSKLSGLENAINNGNGAAGGYAAQAHTDAENISNALGALAKAVNGSGSVQNVEVSVNGSSAEPPTSTDIEGVVSDRVSAAKSRFSNSWSGLQTSFNSIFTITLSGSSDLPKWTWVILGQTVVIDFNDYATELNWIAIAGVLFASISAIFIVFDN